MKSVVQILGVQQISGVSAKTGNPYDMRMAQCIVHKLDRKTALVSPLVGVLNLPEAFKAIPKGVYDIEFTVSVNSKGRVESEVGAILPYDRGAPPVDPVKNIIDIHAVIPLAGLSQKSGREYDMRLGQCSFERPDRKTGEIIEFIGELLLPDRFKDIPPGRYLVEFEPSISKEKRIGSVVYDMVYVGPVPNLYDAPASAVAAPATSPVLPAAESKTVSNLSVAHDAETRSSKGKS